MILLTNRKPQIILRNMRILICIKLRRRDCGDTDFFDQEPSQLKVARPTCDVRWEGVVRWQFDGGHIGEDEVAAFWVGVLHHHLSVSPLCYNRREGRKGGPTGISNSSKTSQNRLILPCISLRDSSQKPSASAFSNATAEASCNGDTLL